MNDRLPGLVPFPPERVTPGLVGVEQLADYLAGLSVDLTLAGTREEVRKIAADVRLTASQIERLAEQER